MFCSNPNYFLFYCSEEYKTIEYKDGLKHGKFIVFGKRGKVLKEIKYSEGMRIIEGQTGGNGSFSPG